MTWIITLVLSISLFLLGIFYLGNQIYRFGFKKKIYSYLALFGVFFVLVFVFNFITAMLIIIHYMVVGLFNDLIFLIVKKVRKKDFKFYITGYATILFTTIYIVLGVYNVYHVDMTEYTVTSDKLINNYKIAFIADSHLGTTFDASGFDKCLQEILKAKPDMLLIAGDFVDDGTSKKDMIEVSSSLGKLELTSGVYFVHGNHDKGYYGEKRGFSITDLEEELVKNDVKVLKDDSILVNDEIYIIGRKDYENRNRTSINDLVKDLDDNKFKIVMDHQPVDYNNEAKNETDLVLSGHTHGGQLFPITYLNTTLSDNDLVYGYEKRKNTNFIVTSGISDWEIKMKTGCKSEYVIINVLKDN